MTELETYNNQEMKSMNEVLQDDFKAASTGHALFVAFGIIMTAPATFVQKLRDQIAGQSTEPRTKEEREDAIKEFGPNFQAEIDKGRDAMLKNLDRLIEAKNQYLDAQANTWFLQDRPEMAITAKGGKGHNALHN